MATKKAPAKKNTKSRSTGAATKNTKARSTGAATKNTKARSTGATKNVGGAVKKRSAGTKQVASPKKRAAASKGGQARGRQMKEAQVTNSE